MQLWPRGMGISGFHFFHGRDSQLLQPSLKLLGLSCAGAQATCSSLAGAGSALLIVLAGFAFREEMKRAVQPCLDYLSYKPHVPLPFGEDQFLQEDPSKAQR